MNTVNIGCYICERNQRTNTQTTERFLLKNKQQIQNRVANVNRQIFVKTFTNIDRGTVPSTSRWHAFSFLELAHLPACSDI